MKTITINGVTFEQKKSINSKERLIYDGTNLYDCYNKPSLRKQRIYEWWEDWYYSFCSDDRLGRITIYSYNTNMFTLIMAIKYNNKCYHLYITPSHNYIMEII